MKQHLALYGNTGIVRGYCYKCRRYSLVVGGLLQCCDRRVEAAPADIKRMSDPEGRRRKLRVNERDEILQAQNYRCLYCDVSLNGYVFYRGQQRRVRETWDHMVPYDHTLNNHASNFAATCQFCNAWKSNLIFKSVDEVRIYVTAKWEVEREAERQLRGMRGEIRETTMVAEVLQTELSVSSLEPDA